MSIEHNRLDVGCRHQKIKLTKSRHILGKQNFQTLHPFQKDTAQWYFGMKLVKNFQHLISTIHR